MHQYLRNGTVQSTFCPLDLFSCDEERIRKAIKGLWEIWADTDGKGNNWRVYVNGIAVTSSEVSFSGHLMLSSSELIL
jgi:inositol-pentakisphosphate 2-kinase